MMAGRLASSMSRRISISVLCVAALLIGAVTAATDWSTPARRDPARALLLGPREAFVAGAGPNPPVFEVTELVLFLAAGAAFVGTGVIAWRRRPSDLTGRLVVAAGLLWLAGGLRRSSEPAVFTAAIILTNLYLPVLIQLMLGFPSGRLRYRWERWVVGSCWVLATVGVAGEWIFFDPRAIALESRSTSVHLLLIRHNPALAEIVQMVVGALAAVAGLLLVVVVLIRLRTRSPAYRAGFAPLGLACLVAVPVTIAILASAIRFPGSQTGWLLDLRYPTTAVLPLAIAVGVARYHVARVALADAMVEIGSASLDEGFVAALRRALHDPSLELWTYSHHERRYVDHDGNRRDPWKTADGRAVTVFERDGTPAGVLVHDESLQAQSELLAAVRGAAELALNHQRMDDELRNRLDEVRRSRQRIVTAGDAQRRRFERDLHDGAQQRLVAASIMLGRAKRAADEQTSRGLLTQCADEIDSALAELRELARGCYPPVLSERGLGAALTSLAERSQLPVEITGTLDGRPDRDAELAAYYTAAEAVTNATKHAHATLVRISLDGHNDELRMIISDDGRGGATPTPGGGLAGLHDRISALDGHLELDSPPDAGTTIEVTLPWQVGERS